MEEKRQHVNWQNLPHYVEGQVCCGTFGSKPSNYPVCGVICSGNCFFLVGSFLLPLVSGVVREPEM